MHETGAGEQLVAHLCPSPTRVESVPSTVQSIPNSRRRGRRVTTGTKTRSVEGVGPARGGRVQRTCVQARAVPAHLMCALTIVTRARACADKGRTVWELGSPQQKPRDGRVVVTVTKRCRSSVVTKRCRSSVVTKRCRSTVVTKRCRSSVVTKRCRSSVVTKRCRSSVVTKRCRSSVVMIRCRSSVVTIRCRSSVVTKRCRSSVVMIRCRSSVVMIRCRSSVVTKRCRSSVVMIRCRSFSRDDKMS